MIKDGYKKTEIGVIPVEWEVVKLKDYVKLTSGKFNPKKNLQDKKNDSFLYPVYGGNGITGFYTDYLVSHSTIIIGRVGEYCGSIHLEKTSIWITDNAIYTKEISPKFNIDFLYEIFNFIGLENLAERTGQPKITQEPIYNLKIPLPPLKEQQEIANILSTADKKIEAIDLQIQKAEMLKKGLLQKLLSEGIGHSEFKDSELGRIPVGWEVKKLDEMTTVVTKGTTPTTLGFKYEESGVNFIKVESIGKNGNFIFDKFAYISKEANNMLQRSIIQENDLLISIAGALGRVAIVNKNILPANTNQALSIIRLKDNYVKEYIYFYLKSSQIQNHIDKINVQNAQANLSLQNIKNFKIPLPPLKEQKQIAQILSTADEKLELLRAKKEKYETLKKGLLQKLLSGEVRVGCCP